MSATPLSEPALAAVDRREIPPDAWRRLLDLAVTAVALVALAPLLALLALLVRATSPGPALFRQARVGEGGRLFTLLKFRSMRQGTAGSEVTANGDPRVTRLGALLRATSLDELPQILNILRGDMTLVGPRPETPALAARYPAAYAVVFRYRPGLTGPAQVHLRDADVLPPRLDDVEAFYLTTLVPRRVAADLEYLRHPTPGGTFALLAATVASVVRTAWRARPGASAADRSGR
jgi:lipopolysaccharide/colanic/teichoic acid biosynthesis glycosyltransferase